MELADELQERRTLYPGGSIESSSLHGPELHPLAASVTIILSEPLLVAMMHSNTMLARFGTAGAMAAASTPREELLLHMSVDRC